jgi:pimeloyl-ACP methyl ester carboxylesterase
MVLAPDGDPPVGGRDVVAWAHGTVGMGRDCTPSLGRNPIADMPWLPQMLRRGWVVTATDYAGLGTPGTLNYLVGASEAHDVLNSVRALTGLPAAGAGDRYAVWGHSQGGHAALSAAEIAARYLPAEHLVGAAAAAPASDLVGQFEAQWRRPISWVIGSEVLVSWPAVYADAEPSHVTTDLGRRVYASEARRCVAAGALSGTIRSRLGQRLFRVDPMSDAAFRRIGAENTPDHLRRRCRSSWPRGSRTRWCCPASRRGSWWRSAGAG